MKKSNRTVVLWVHPKEDGVRVVADLNIIEANIKDLPDYVSKITKLEDHGYSTSDIEKLVLGGLKL